ncbi:MAG: hypothetical protein K9M45_06900 [Kiritimatiellales bacterium]|nr:hypothetical protein [Kiritimatiellales bacterium]
MNTELRIPPHSEEAERGILGSILLDPNYSIPKCNDIGLKSEAFYDRRHQTLFDELLSMYRVNGRAMDAITIADWLKDKGQLDKIGGYDYLIQLQDSTLVAAHIQHYADSVQKSHLKRQVIEQASAAIDLAYRPGTAETELIQSMQNFTLDISASEKNTGKEEAVASILQMYADAKAGGTKGVPIQFQKINSFTGGAPKGLVTVLCGRGGKGKSMFLGQWLNMLGKEGIPATSLCFEDGIETTMARMASCRGGYSHFKMSMGDGRPDWDQLATDCLGKVRAYPVEFVSKKMNIEQIRNRLFQDRETRGIEVAIIDGFKDISRPSTKYNDTGFEEYISQELTDIARRLNIAVVVVLHLQKIPPNVEIDITNIRGSAQIANDCRVAWALQDFVSWNGAEKEKYGHRLQERDEYGSPAVYAFSVIKTNHGKTCRVPIQKQLDLSRFDELTNETEQELPL